MHNAVDVHTVAKETGSPLDQRVERTFVLDVGIVLAH